MRQFPDRLSSVKTKLARRLALILKRAVNRIGKVAGIMTITEQFDQAGNFGEL